MKRSLIVVAVVMLVAWPAAQAQDYRFFGTSSLQGDGYDGTFLAFGLSEAGVEDLQVRGTPMMDLLEIDVTEASQQGAKITLGGPNASVSLHDNPTAHVKVTARGPFELAWDVEADADAQTDGGKVLVRRGVEAAVWSPDTDVTLDDGTVRASLEAGQSVLFRVRPGGGSFPALSAHEPEITRAVESGRVGVEAFVQGGPSSRAGHDVATYAPLDVLVRQGEAVELTVGSEDPRGRVVVVRADDLALQGPGDVRVRFDGEPAGTADGIADVLDPTDDGGLAEAFTAQVSGADVVLVSVPGFSVHEITIERVVELVQEHPEVAIPTIAGGLLVVAAATWGMFRPKDGDGLV